MQSSLDCTEVSLACCTSRNLIGLFVRKVSSNDVESRRDCVAQSLLRSASPYSSTEGIPALEACACSSGVALGGCSFFPHPPPGLTGTSCFFPFASPPGQRAGGSSLGSTASILHSRAVFAMVEESNSDACSFHYFFNPEDIVKGRLTFKTFSLLNRILLQGL